MCEKLSILSSVKVNNNSLNIFFFWLLLLSLITPLIAIEFVRANLKIFNSNMMTTSALSNMCDSIRKYISFPGTYYNNYIIITYYL